MKEIGSNREMGCFKDQKEAFGEAIWSAKRNMLQDGVYLTFDDQPSFMVVFRILVDRGTVVVSSYSSDEPPSSEVSWQEGWVATADHRTVGV
jgi:hypothetical protein